MNVRGRWKITLSLLLASAFGCSKSDLVDVNGMVTWESAAVPHGDIVFVDTDPHVPSAAGKIVDGAYSFQCKPGKKRIEIKSYRLSGRLTPQGNPIGEMYIPSRYSSQSELTADVTEGGDNKFDFSLTP